MGDGAHMGGHLVVDSLQDWLLCTAVYKLCKVHLNDRRTVRTECIHTVPLTVGGSGLGT